MEDKKIAIGDYLGTIEEFVPGEGTYAEEGKIYASAFGNLQVDKENHIIGVDCKTTPKLEKGSIVFGDVLDIKKNSVVIIARRIKGFKGDIDVKTGLFVSNISDGYVEKPDDLFAIGDIVKGVIIKMECNLIDISTKGSMGVVKAFCRKCRCPLEKSAKIPSLLLCPCCGNKEKRKIAEDYGSVTDI